jgi:N-acyl-L-homoserine lactone synthetase
VHRHGGNRDSCTHLFGVVSMITIIEDHNAEDHRYLLAAMFKQRARVLGPLGLGWAVRIDNWGWETDDLDDQHPVYVIVHGPSLGVLGSLRLLPTTGPTLLERIFPHTAPTHISAPDIWEMTRLCVEGNLKIRTLLELFRAVGEVATRSGVNSVIGNVTPSHYAMYARIGIPIEKLGGDDNVLLVSIPMDTAIPAVAEISEGLLTSSQSRETISTLELERTTDMKSLDEILETQGYAAAKAEADRRGVIWFASAGAKRKPK